MARIIKEEKNESGSVMYREYDNGFQERQGNLLRR